MKIVTPAMTELSREGQFSPSVALPAIAAMVRRQRRSVVGAILTVLALTLLVYALVPRRFAARADVKLDQRTDGPTSDGRPARIARNTEIRVLTSNDVVGQVVDQLDLERVPGIGQPKDGPALPVERARAGAMAAVHDRLEIRSSESSFAVAVGYASTDPALAAGIVNRLVDDYVEYRRSGGVRGRESARLRVAADEAHESLIRAQSALTGYRSATSLISSPRQIELIKQEISTLDAQLAAAWTDQKAVEARLDSAAPGRGRASAPTSQRLRELRGEQAQLNAERAKIATRGALDADVAALDARLADINRDTAGENKRVADVLGTVRTARDRTALAAAARDRAGSELREIGTVSQQLARLEASVGSAQRRYASFLGRYRELAAGLRAGSGGPYIIAHAPVPVRPAFPDPLIFGLVGVLAALVAAAGVALAPELLSRGFLSRQQFERKLGIPVIGMVPDLNRVPGAHLPSDDPSAPMDYVLTDSRSAFSAAFRSIHTGLRLDGGAHRPRSVAVSSALPEEGKTTVSICLARSAALAGLRVVLVDCDVRRPAATRYLTAHVEAGLIEVLQGRVPLREALRRDTPSGAWLLAISTDGPVASDLVGSDAMRTLVAQLARDYDLIVLDTAPALALAEARAVAAMADSVLLVARWRTTPIEATRIALDLLTKSDAKVTAAVLTLVAP